MKSDSFKERNRALGLQKKSKDHLSKHKQLGKARYYQKRKSINYDLENSLFSKTSNSNLSVENNHGQRNVELDYEDKKNSLKRDVTKEVMALDEYAELVKSHVHIISYNGRLYLYNKPCYIELNQQGLITLYRENIDYGLYSAKSLHVYKELYNYLISDPEILVKDIDYSELDDYAILENCVFDVKNQRMLKHSSKYYVFSYINAKYVENDDTPAFDDFLDTVTQKNPILIKRIWYLIAYLCMQSTAAKAFFVLGTAPNSGKSVFGRFIQNLFGTEYVSSIALNDMHKDFGMAPLVGKAVNISMDLPSGKLNTSAVSNLKMLTGDDEICINEKFVPRFGYRNKAKMLFGTNHPISIQCEDEAFWNRLEYFPFNYSIPKEEQDTKLLQKLLKEKDAVVSKALRYGKKFIKNNYTFPSTQEIEDVVASWKGEKNYSIENFLRDCCDINPSYEGEWTADLYAAYEQYCTEFNKEVVSKEFFKKFLEGQQRLKCAKFRKEEFPGNPRHGYRGIMLETR